MDIVRAISSDSDVLTEVTKKSKDHWGYGAAQIEAWGDALKVINEYIEANNVYKLQDNQTIVGYYAYFSEDAETVRLDNLFVLPEYIGRGLGKLLLEDFLERTKGDGAHRITVHSDPNAEGFYKAFGFKTIGYKETSIKDRYLPIMELTFINY